MSGLLLQPFRHRLEFDTNNNLTEIVAINVFDLQYCFAYTLKTRISIHSNETEFDWFAHFNFAILRMTDENENKTVL